MYVAIKRPQRDFLREVIGGNCIHQLENLKEELDEHCRSCEPDLEACAVRRAELEAGLALLDVIGWGWKGKGQHTIETTAWLRRTLEIERQCQAERLGWEGDPDEETATREVAEGRANVAMIDGLLALFEPTAVAA